MSNSVHKILHVWGDYSSTHFDQTHPLISQWPNAESYLVAGNLIDNGCPVLPHSFYVYRLPPEIISSPALHHRLLKKYYHFVYWSKLERLCRKIIAEKKITVIHFHFGTTGSRMMKRLSDLKLPKIVSFYGMDASETLKSRQWSALYKNMFSNANAFIVLCDEVKKRLTSAGAPAEKITTWNIPASIERYLTITPQQKPFRLITAARFIEKKGYPYLLRGFKKALESEPHLELTALGYGPDKHAILKDIDELGLSKHIKLIDTNIAHDFDDVFSRLLGTHSAFIITSVQATNGDDEAGPALTMIKAQAAGHPVICSNFPGSEITLKPNVSGLYVDPTKERSVADAIIFLARNLEKAKEYGEQSRVLATEEFSIQLQSERLKQIYNHYIS